MEPKDSKEYVKTKQYSIYLLPDKKNKANKKAKKNGKTFSAYINDLIDKDLKEID